MVYIHGEIYSRTRVNAPKSILYNHVPDKLIGEFGLIVPHLCVIHTKVKDNVVVYQTIGEGYS